MGGVGGVQARRADWGRVGIACVSFYLVVDAVARGDGARPPRGRAPARYQDGAAERRSVKPLVRCSLSLQLYSL